MLDPPWLGAWAMLARIQLRGNEISGFLETKHEIGRPTEKHAFSCVGKRVLNLVPQTREAVRTVTVTVHRGILVHILVCIFETNMYENLFCKTTHQERFDPEETLLAVL